MPSFQYRFEPLLALRRRQRDAFGRELCETQEAIDRIDHQAAALQQQRDQIRAKATSRFSASGSPMTSLSVDRLRHEARYDRQLATDQVMLQQSRHRLEVELERQRDRLLESEADVKRLERLREKQAAEHQHLQLQREQTAADEVTNARAILTRRKAY